MNKHSNPDKTTQEKRWYQKTLWIIVFLILFWPLGIYLMWRHAAWKNLVKTAITILELLFFVLFVIAIMNPTPSVTLDSSYHSTLKTDDAAYLVSGVAPTNETVKANGIPALRNGDRFKVTVPLRQGDNQITVTATNGSNKVEKKFIIHRNTSTEIKAREDAAAAAKKTADEAAAKKVADAVAAKAKAAATAKTKAIADAKVKAKQAAADAAAATIANASAEQKSALAQATSYANTQYMSKQGLYDQLVSPYGGQFSASAGQFAIDHVVANWNANALQTARDYQNQQHMSPAAIHDQLTSQYGEKFTQTQADYAIKHLND